MTNQKCRLDLSELKGSRVHPRKGSGVGRKEGVGVGRKGPS